MKNNFIVPLLTLILGGGFAAAILNLVRAKNENRKAPVERDAVIVNSAESAVVIMQKVLDATTKQLTIKETEVQDLTSRLITVKQELVALRTKCEELEELLNLMTKEHGTLAGIPSAEDEAKANKIVSDLGRSPQAKEQGK